MRVVGGVEIDRPASQVWAYVADYGNDTSWRAGVIRLRPSRPGPAQVGTTTHETLRLLRLTFHTDATIDRVEADACSPGMPTIARSNCEELGWWSQPARGAIRSGSPVGSPALAPPPVTWS